MSASRDPDGGYLRWPREESRAFLGAQMRTVLFFPFAGVTETWARYAERVRAPFGESGYDVHSVDMPIVEPPSLDALGLVPFQINAHFTDVRPPGFQGETRSERLAEYLEVNRAMRVVGLPEGTMLRVEPDVATLLGGSAARVFESGQQPRDYAPGEALGFLMR